MGKKRFAIKIPRGIELLKQKDIVYCSASGRYTYIYTLNGRKYIICKLISELEVSLDPGHFFRTHRSYIVNLSHIVRYENGDHNPIIMVNDKKIELARRRRSLFNKRLKERTIRI